MCRTFIIDNSVSFHHRNLHCFTTELYKKFKNTSPDIMKDIFPLNTSSIYDARNRQTFYTRPAKLVYKDTELLSSLTPKICELIPESIKSIDLLSTFNIAIKQWKPNDCSCRFC